MTDQSPTERIRTMLDERGVEHETKDGCIFIRKGDMTANFIEFKNGLVCVTMQDFLTPEQAIAATLGEQHATAELQSLSKLKMAGRLRYWRGTIEIPEVELHAICDQIQTEHEQAIAATMGSDDAYTREDCEAAFVRGYSLGSLPAGSDPQWDENRQTVDEHMAELGWVRAATLGSGADETEQMNGRLTAEQVREAIERHVEFYEGGDYDEQAIADELNTELGSEISGDTSDGYHTFNELYHHRAVLFSVIVCDHRELAWKARKHHDGTMYDGMFIVGIETPKGQATYHYDLDPYWEMFDCEEREYAPEWDGHTSDEAIARIAELGNGTCEMETDHDELELIASSHEDTWGYRCSACGWVFRYDRGIKPDYCPNCGRKVVSE